MRGPSQHTPRRGGTGIESYVVASEAQGVPLNRNASFLLLWAGQFISQIGDRLAALALPWLVYTTTGSALGTGAVFALYTLPYVLFGAFAGVAVDRFDKRRLMIAADLIRAALVLAVPFVAERSLPAVFVLSFAISTAAVFFDPAKLAILPEIVPPGRLLRANSLLSTGENLTEILGWALAGALLASVSTAAAFELDAITFAVSAVALTLMRYRAPARAAAERSARAFWHEMREGFSFLRHDRGLRANTIMILVCVAGLGASYPLTFLLAVEVLDGGTGAFGALEAVVGAGYLAGSLAVLAFAPRVRKGRLMIGGLALMGGCLALVATAGFGVDRGDPVRRLRHGQCRSADRRGHVHAGGRATGHARTCARHAVHAHAGHVRALGTGGERPGRDRGRAHAVRRRRGDRGRLSPGRPAVERGPGVLGAP